MSEIPEFPEPRDEKVVHTVRSLRELIDIVTGKNFQPSVEPADSGLAEILPFPFLALVGQEEMKLALLLSIINPLVNGVLLIGPRGTGKTTAVRSLIHLLPDVERSNCFLGCLPEDIEAGGIDAVCPDCARKYAEGVPLTRQDRVRLIELPLNASLEAVIGGVDENALAQNRMPIRRGILAQADLNVLYVDEVNLLDSAIINAILDAASAGAYTVRKENFSATYRSRFTLIGSMNPEEGNLRPQIMDRFGLRVLVKGLEDHEERLEAYRRSRAYRLNPRATVQQYQEETIRAREEIIAARDLLTFVEIPPKVAHLGIQMIRHLNIDSIRAEITLLEAARAYAAADARTTVSENDLRMVAPMALRFRHSEFMLKYFEEQEKEDQALQEYIEQCLSHPENPPGAVPLAPQPDESKEK